jgi:hypothetical protein
MNDTSGRLSHTDGGCTVSWSHNRTLYQLFDLFAKNYVVYVHNYKTCLLNSAYTVEWRSLFQCCWLVGKVHDSKSPGIVVLLSQFIEMFADSFLVKDWSYSDVLLG